MALTLAEIRLQSRQRADMENSTFLSDSEWNANINASYAELYDILVSRFEDYYSGTFQFTLNDTNEQPLPSDVYKVRGVDFQLTPNEWGTVGKFNFQDRNKINKSVVRDLWGVYNRNYRVMGNKILILPRDKGPGTYRVWFIPRFTPLVNDNDLMGDVLDFQEYVIVDAAIKARLKEESDVQELMVIKQQLKDRIEAMASNRDTTPERITDVSTYYDDYFYWSRF